MDEHVERLHMALAAALREHRPKPFSAPVTVAEISQDLVPYRSVRSSVGFEMNADYEHALLQLLAGVGGHARIEPERAGEEMREELKSPNPNVGLFRKFAACEVWVSEPLLVEQDGDQTDAFAPEPTRPEDEPIEARVAEAAATEPETTGASPKRYMAPSLWRPSSESDEDAAADPAPTIAREPAAGTARVPRPRGIAPPVGQPEIRPDFDPRCGFCDSALPGGRIVRFCPHCGADQALRPCASCGEPLDSTWGFCIACGAAQE